MKRLLLSLFLLPLFLFAQDDLINRIEGNRTVEGYEFTQIVNHDATPVKNQGSSSTCWSYCTTSFLESEMIRLGKKPVNISEMYTVRKVYEDKAKKYVRLGGHLNFGQGGALPDVLYVLKRYGAVPYDLYTGLQPGQEINKHDEMESILRGIVDNVIKNENGTLSNAWQQGYYATLDAYLGAEPKEFTYNGMKYTPRTFADQVIGINPDNYVQLTSFIYQPSYEEVYIEVPDNWAWGTSYNLPLDELISTIDFALQNGHTVSWAADVSEKGFSVKSGIAKVPMRDWKLMSAEEQEEFFKGPTAELNVTPEIRQAQYDSYETTDDHGMHITGMAKDQNGNKYYIVKNSWGTKYGFDGYLYISEAYVRLKTIGILVHRDAIPKDVQKKIQW